MSDLLPFEIDIPARLIKAIRMYYGDLPEFNRLIEGTEVSDEKIALATQLWIQHFNQQPPILNTSYDATNFKNYMVLFDGVIIQLLKVTGIIQTRNFLNFNDGGVSFTVNDKGGEYMQWMQTLLSQHSQDVRDMKRALNAEDAYDILPSPEGLFFSNDWQ
jgi:hypothetical protein